MKSIASELHGYGIPADAVVEFGANPTAREVRYLDLLRFRKILKRMHCQQALSNQRLGRLSTSNQMKAWAPRP